MSDRTVSRRTFLQQSVVSSGVAALALQHTPLFAAQSSPGLRVGEGVVDTTPPTGIELAGFHRSPGNERLITGIRQPTAARAIVLESGKTKFVIVSLDIIAVSRSFADDVRKEISAAIKVPAEHVRICATHTHSMPTFCYLRQWGKIPEDYLEKTKQSIVQAAKLAHDDLAPAELHLGSSSAKGANFNRTASEWKTDREFDKSATDDQRWLDTQLHVLRFDRSAGKPPVLWYHFSAHPVCYTDGLAGPDWVGGVAARVCESEKITPGFLQGHIGDVNPGDGTPWIGDPTETVSAVYDAFRRALAAAKPVAVNEVRAATSEFKVPLDMERLKQELEAYQKNPDECASGPWVDAPFAADWFAAAQKWDLSQQSWPTPISALQLGPLGMLFHSTELYSYYGLAIRHASPFENTLVVSYADDMVGYVTDPKAYDAGEYAAITVPKILGIPPFTKDAGREFTAAAGKLLKSLT